MSERQKTFGDIVGLEADVPVGIHREDWIECSDGTLRHNDDIIRDCRDGAHGSEEDAQDSNVEIVTEILMGHEKWTIEYTTENSDYPDGCAYICDEDAINWRDRFEEHICECLKYKYDIEDDAKDIAREIYERMSAGLDVEAEYDRCEYSAYSGNGFSPYSLEIGEYHNQVEIASHKELQVLHNDGVLDTVLDDVNCDVFVSRRRRRKKNETTGYYEHVGRKMYDPYGSDYPCLDLVHDIPGQWHYVLSDESIDQMIEDELERREYYNKETD